MPREFKQPYVRFFASDWLAGTRGMTAVETGVYITLIALMYERCEPVPDDRRRLARECGCTSKVFAAAIDFLTASEKIIRKDDGLWSKRVEKEFNWRAQNSTNAREAAKKRWQKPNKNNDENMPPQCDRNANAMQEGMHAGATSQKPEAILKNENNQQADSTSSARAREAHDAIDGENNSNETPKADLIGMNCLALMGWVDHPRQNYSLVHTWLAIPGIDAETHIYPTIRRIVAEGRRPSSLAYFTKPIREAVEESNRLCASPPALRRYVPEETRCRQEFARTGVWPERGGPMPADIERAVAAAMAGEG